MFHDLLKCWISDSFDGPKRSFACDGRPRTCTDSCLMWTSAQGPGTSYILLGSAFRFQLAVYSPVSSPGLPPACPPRPHRAVVYAPQLTKACAAPFVRLHHHTHLPPHIARISQSKGLFLFNAAFSVTVYILSTQTPRSQLQLI